MHMTTATALALAPDKWKDLRCVQGLQRHRCPFTVSLSLLPACSTATQREGSSARKEEDITNECLQRARTKQRKRKVNNHKTSHGPPYVSPFAEARRQLATCERLSQQPLSYSYTIVWNVCHAFNIGHILLLCSYSSERTPKQPRIFVS